MFVDRSIDPTADQRARRCATCPTSGPSPWSPAQDRAQARYRGRRRGPCTGLEAYSRTKKAFTETVGPSARPRWCSTGRCSRCSSAWRAAGRRTGTRCWWCVIRRAAISSAMMADATTERPFARYAGLERTVLLQVRGVMNALETWHRLVRTATRPACGSCSPRMRVSFPIVHTPQRGRQAGLSGTGRGVQVFFNERSATCAKSWASATRCSNSRTEIDGIVVNAWT